MKDSKTFIYLDNVISFLPFLLSPEIESHQVSRRNLTKWQQFAHRQTHTAGAHFQVRWLWFKRGKTFANFPPRKPCCCRAKPAKVCPSPGSTAKSKWSGFCPCLAWLASHCLPLGESCVAKQHLELLIVTVSRVRIPKYLCFGSTVDKKTICLTFFVFAILVKS